MHDSVALEDLGLPAAAIITSEFVVEAGTQLAALGRSDLQPVVIEHPLSTLGEEQIDARADAATPEVLRTWTGER